ncbi:MAG: TonB family protein [Candidatus Marinimicrobia bacterium]|jgi:TonB family protein|nr:TonB family protein [Candidatus Neomarinimicrobiota bacterium]MBT3629896.1 TonB family protein [Candidatus Neomarinimicrobiota bacterium]MBT3824478.1 TonB family protein [Candidatus Neomarinimicrobiota bacterium]MBT4132757.1 TonB family protein [Candidatus Neomarinimicrobiota bacterium]MBT4295348.1 TonB family protein [Candidatus Neomarinimicrobiota bacterium]
MVDQLINILLQSSWQILILSIIVWPLSRLSIRSYPNFAYILWVVILVKALIPINITLPSQQIPVAVFSPVITGEFIQGTVVASASNFSINTLIAMIWLIGVLFLAVKLMVSEISHRKRLGMAEVLEPESWFHSMKADLGIKQEIHLYVHERIHSPLMQGLWNVRIYLPQEYKSWTLAEKQSVIAHELTHIRRLDIVIIYLQAIVKTLYFFHPVIWLVNDQIDLEREKICDDEAIELSTTDRRAYGDQLFRQLSTEEGQKSVPVLAGGFFMSDSSIIKRFRYIKEKRGDMNGKLKYYHVMLILVVTSLAVLIACNSEVPQSTTEPTGLEKAPALNENEVFQAYDVPPQPVGGYAAIQENVKYPELARESGIGGTTIVQVTINAQGKAGNSLVLRSAGDESLDAAAVNAAMATEWIPAQQEGSPVGVRISIPIVFKLKEGGSDHSVSSATATGKRDWDVSPRPENWKAIGENIIYPEQAKQDGVTGTLTMQFTIDERGTLLSPIVRSGPDHAALKAAAIVALKSTKWLPAEKDGQPIAATMEMGIGFGTEEEQNKTQKIANGVRPLDRLGKVPVTIKGPNAAARAEDISFKIYINSDGLFEGISGSLSTNDEGVEVDQKALDMWMKSNWEAVPKTDRLEGQWIDVPLEFTFID